MRRLKIRHHTAFRRAGKKTPKWADKNKIERFYLGCPEGYEVDHIVPCRGENVTGLHVLENLQYLPISANKHKSNKH